MPTPTPKKLPANRTQFSLTFEASDVTKAEDAALKKIGRSVKIPGFREGKAPVELIREKVEAETLLEEVVRSLVTPLLATLAEEHKLAPILPPRLTIEKTSPLSVAVIFVEKPDVKLKGAEKIKIEKKEPKADAKDVERMVEYLISQARSFKEVDRAAKTGDQVTMDFYGTDKDGTEVAGIRSTGYPVIIGSSTLLPGFEDALVDLKKGDTKDIPLTFPAKYHAEHLQNKPVTFHVTVTKVEEVHSPAFDDAFTKQQGLGGSAEEVRKRIEKSLIEQELGMDRQRRERELFDAIRNATKLEIAPELVEQAVSSIIRELEGELSRQNQTFEQWLKRSKKDVKELQKEFEEQAEQRLTLRFGVEQLLEDRAVTLTDEEMTKAVEEALNSMDPAERDQSIANGRFAKGSDDYAQLQWQKRVERLAEQMLA